VLNPTRLRKNLLKVDVVLRVNVEIGVDY